jgi:hypothetical protein
LGATIFRADADDAYDDFEDEELDDFDQSIADERAKIKSSTKAQN